MNILVVAELAEGTARKTTLAAIRAAQQMNAEAFDILSVGQQSKVAAETLSHYGAGRVWQVEIGGGYFAEKYAATVAAMTTLHQYDVVVATASTYGKDLMPRVAAKLQAGLAPDVESIAVENGQVICRRAMFAGNLFGTLQITTAVKIITVRQSEFEAASSVEGSPSPVVEAALVPDAVAGKLEFVSLKVAKSERPELSEADVVVAGGRALRSAENFQKIMEPLADTLHAAVGASRAACDAGYVSNQLQVGQTGKVVAPKLYIAVGISGAIQHLAGMKGSKTIVAINKDKEAPIAQVADYFLAADLFQAVPELTEKLRQLKAAG